MYVELRLNKGFQTGGKPVGRRLRFCYEYCLEINAQLRGLPWPPVEKVVEDKDDESTGSQGIDVDINDHEGILNGEELIESGSEHHSEPDENDHGNEEDQSENGHASEEQAASQESGEQPECIDPIMPTTSPE